AMLNGFAELNERVLDGLSHLTGNRRSQRRHLAIPANPQVTPQSPQAGKLAQRVEVLRTARSPAVYARLCNELAPVFVFPEGVSAQLPAELKMLEDLIGGLLLFFELCGFSKYRTIFKERPLAIGCLAMNVLNKRNQLFPWLAVNTAVFAGINGGKLPLFLPRQ